MKTGIIVVLLALPNVAFAVDVPCAPVQSSVIQIDGLIGDWRGVRAVSLDSSLRAVRGRGHWEGTEDLGVNLRCNHSDDALFFAVVVRDDRFVAHRRPDRGEFVDFAVGRRSVKVYPGDLRQIERRVSCKPNRCGGISVAEARQRDGYSIEMRIPLRQARYRVGRYSLPLRVRIGDADQRNGRIETEIVAESARLVFAQARENLDAFLRDVKADRASIRLHRVADLCRDSAMEQVVWVGRTVAVIGDGLSAGGYLYFSPPVRRPEDLLSVALMDFDADGKAEIVVRHIERAENGRRGVLSVYRFNRSDELVRVFAHEVLKGQGERVITNRVRFMHRRKNGKMRKGVAIVIDQPKARGFDASTFHEGSASDMHGILLPWGDERRRKFCADDGVFVSVQ